MHLTSVYHGIATPIQVMSLPLTVNRQPLGDGSQLSTVNGKLFNGLGDEFIVGRYHSWVVSDEGFPTELEVTARDKENFIMALQHKTYDVQGVQFHPESVLTPSGEVIMRNWLSQSFTL